MRRPPKYITTIGLFFTATGVSSGFDRPGIGRGIRSDGSLGGPSMPEAEARERLVISQWDDCFKTAVHTIQSEYAMRYPTIELFENSSQVLSEQRARSSISRSRCESPFLLHRAFHFEHFFRIASISMTLCEITTTERLSVPLECQEYRNEAHYTFSDKRLSKIDTVQSQCVEALSRSAQLWTSYSGYLREIPQLCFAFGTWNEVDIAKSLYRNATIEISALLAVLRRDADRMALAAEEISKSTGIFGSLSSALEQTSITLDRSANQFRNTLYETWDELREMLHVASHKFHHEMQQHRSEVVSTFQSSFVEHDEKFTGILITIQRAIDDYKHVTRSIFTDIIVNLTAVMSHANLQWGVLHSHIDLLQENMYELSKRSHVVLHEVELGANAATRVHQALENSVLAAEKATESLIALTNVANTEMVFLNSTAQAVHANFAELMHPIPILASDVWRQWAVSLRQFAPDYILDMFSSHLTRILVTTLRTIVALLRVILVYFGSGVLVILSISRRFSAMVATSRSAPQPDGTPSNSLVLTGYRKRTKNKARVSLPYNP